MSPALSRAICEADLIELERLLDALRVVYDARHAYFACGTADEWKTRQERLRTMYCQAKERVLSDGRIEKSLNTLEELIAMARRR